MPVSQPTKAEKPKFEVEIDEERKQIQEQLRHKVSTTKYDTQVLMIVFLLLALFAGVYFLQHAIYENGVNALTYAALGGTLYAYPVIKIFDEFFNRERDKRQERKVLIRLIIRRDLMLERAKQETDLAKQAYFSGDRRVAKHHLQRVAAYRAQSDDAALAIMEEEELNKRVEKQLHSRGKQK